MVGRATGKGAVAITTAASSSSKVRIAQNDALLETNRLNTDGRGARPRVHTNRKTP